MALVLKGILLGMLNAAPVGPVGLLCLRKNMEKDRWPGLFAGMGMAVAYAIISFCVVFGLKAISLFLHEHESIFQLLGGAILILMGWRGLRPPRSTLGVSPPGSVRYLGEFSASFVMTLFNPVPFASFTVILTGFQIFRGHPEIRTDLIFSVSVMVGALAFWVVVNEFLHHFKKRSPEALARRVGLGTSIALLVFGVMIAAKGLFQG
ncbi:MAG: LysE family transporter [Verrucomicrobiales bacterium]